MFFNSIALLLTSITLAAHPVENLKRPLLTIPIGQIESELDSKARGRCGEKGAWQVIERWHGKVPRGLSRQARQHERILDGLIAEHKGDICTAVMRYNSYKNKKAGRAYLAKVRKRVFEYYFIV